ncbi:hypothetical protein A8C56_19900 [Niabella ginsenosidivorans]|uniref:DUF1003 domain-containing protein n=1 Tax=Niabella ginsenosidivorans TaxID=1176587 RepID=A0A1A9I7C7_9BACT|nr:DUF1003 domain-containing protein [Niabella ginsenosidivorans]ANH82949.1 hypothetical protein A8C56_19900 [Niabella ginsenosidivorans]
MTLKEQNKIRLERIANIATQWIGSTSSLVFHTLLFIVAFLLPVLHIMEFDKMLLVLTTIVSLEAIYLAIFIQMSVNKNSQDIEEIQEDIEEIQEDVEEIQENVEELQENVDTEATLLTKETPPVIAAMSPTDEKLQHIQLLLQQLQQEVAALKEAH